MAYFQCVRDDSITKKGYYGDICCKMCKGTLASSLYELDLKDPKVRLMVQAYEDHLDYITSKHELIWNKEGTRILARKIYTKKGVVVEEFDDDGNHHH